MATNDLIPIEPTDITHREQVGQRANGLARRYVFEDYRREKAKNTLRRQERGLTLFAECLIEKGLTEGEGFLRTPDFRDDQERQKWLRQQGIILATSAQAWEGVTWGLLKHFLKWQLDRGYSIAGANVRLSTVRVYANLAHQAGIISEKENGLIQGVKGKSRKGARNIDEKREAAGLVTRRGHKKATNTKVTEDAAMLLKTQPDTPQGRRDALMMILLADFGMRVSELALLDVTDFNLKEKRLDFYCPKTNDMRRLELSPDVLRSAMAYIEKDALAMGPLLRTSRKDGRLHDAGMSARAINARVRALGEAVGIENLSPHDLRHYAATREAKRRTTRELMDYFGWKSAAMAVRYQTPAEVQDWRGDN